MWFSFTEADAVLTIPRRDLREYLAQVPDPRGRKGRHHVFVATRTATVCAILQNCRGYAALVIQKDRAANGWRNSHLTFSTRWGFGGRLPQPAV